MQKALYVAKEDVVDEVAMLELVPEEKGDDEKEPEMVCVEMEEWAWGSGGLEIYGLG
jgi:hypothetical protein